MQNQLVPYNQYGLGRTLADTKTGGFFKRLFGKIKESFLGKNPIIAGIIAVSEWVLNIEIGGGDASVFTGSWRISDSTLTPQEQTILDLFDNNLFTPFYISLLKEAQGIFSSGISLDEQISRTNIILAKICAVEKHFTATPAPFLSTNALNIRNEYISETLGVIELYIFQQFKLQNFAKVVVTRNMSDYFFEGLITKTAITTFTCEAYQKTANTPTTPVIAAPIVYDAVVINENQAAGLEPNKASSYLLPIILISAVVVAIVASKKEKQQ